MMRIEKYLFLLLITCSMQIYAQDSYQPRSGDTELDALLIAINNKVKNKTERFNRVLASEFQAPENKVIMLFTHFELTAADALMTLSVAGLSGEPINSVAKAYIY